MTKTFGSVVNAVSSIIDVISSSNSDIFVLNFYNTGIGIMRLDTEKDSMKWGVDIALPSHAPRWGIIEDLDSILA
jgi:hypothetical protein